MFTFVIVIVVTSIEESLEDDDEWHRMQQGVDKIEKVLDTKLRLSHDVHAPFFPGVRNLLEIAMCFVQNLKH